MGLKLGVGCQKSNDVLGLNIIWELIDQHLGFRKHLLGRLHVADELLLIPDQLTVLDLIGVSIVAQCARFRSVDAFEIWRSPIESGGEFVTLAAVSLVSL